MGAKECLQLNGGIHRFLEAWPDGGGVWQGLNLVFDKRVAHGTTPPTRVEWAVCDLCHRQPCDDYRANARCRFCRARLLACQRCRPHTTAAAAAAQSGPGLQGSPSRDETATAAAVAVTARSAEETDSGALYGGGSGDHDNGEVEGYLCLGGICLPLPAGTLSRALPPRHRIRSSSGAERLHPQTDH